jgi:hypothetical protein
VELLTKLRPNGRILDNFQLSVNGPQILDLELEFDHMLPVEPLKGFRLCYQYWLQDIAIRRSLTTSCLLDVSDLVESNNATVLDPSGAGILNAEFQRILSELPDEGPVACAI